MRDERWKVLCEEASTEQDSEKLLELVAEINTLIEQRQRRVRNNATHSTPLQSKNAPAEEA
jgi:hypothetical protein